MRVLDWTMLSTDERHAALERPAQRGAERIVRESAEIVEAVRRGGDAALLELTERLDGVRLGSLEVSEAEFEAAERSLSTAQHRALEVAIGTVRAFHAAQSPAPLAIETARTGSADGRISAAPGRKTRMSPGCFWWRRLSIAAAACFSSASAE